MASDRFLMLLGAGLVGAAVLLRRGSGQVLFQPTPSADSFRRVGAGAGAAQQGDRTMYAKNKVDTGAAPPPMPAGGWWPQRSPATVVLDVQAWITQHDASRVDQL